jgi:Nif-specific regulatory protein
MKSQLNKNYFNIEHLESFLFSTLDEKLFFDTLAEFLQTQLKVDRILAYYLQEKGTLKLVSSMGKKGTSSPKNLLINEGAGGYVLRTKSPYFSNNVKRDPIFSNDLKAGIASELCFPIQHDGLVIATLHFQNYSNEQTFCEEFVDEIKNILKKINRPISNIKMYLTAKHLNEALLKKIEVQEKEIKNQKEGTIGNNVFQVKEEKLLSNTETMMRVLEITEKLSHCDINFLIKGERGTGKEILAKRIHCRGARKNGPFVSIDCSLFSDNDLIEEIFGHEFKSFDKSLKPKLGLLELANGGSFLIKNIECLSEEAQARLSQFLRDKLGYRINGKSPYRSNVRIMASTKIDLKEKAFEKKNFREDLLYRINAFTLDIPSLKERKEDLSCLAGYFLSTDEFKVCGKEKSLSPRALSQLTQYDWPGNVVELQNILKRATLLTDGSIIEVTHLPSFDSINLVESDEESKEEEDYVEMTLGNLERKHICRTLSFLGGNKTKTAKTLGITVKTLYNKLHSYGMINTNI